MHVIDLTVEDESPPPPPPRPQQLPPIHVAEPIGVNVCVDVMDLTEDQSDGEQEMHSVPQHLDWNYIAEQRAAHAAFQALRCNPNDTTLQPNSQITRPSRRNNNDYSQMKRNDRRKQPQQPAGESSSPRKNKRQKKSEQNGNCARWNCDDRKQSAKRKKRRCHDPEAAREVPKNASRKNAKDNNEAAAQRKKERKRRKNLRRRRNVATRKSEETGRGNSDDKTQSGLASAKTSYSSSKAAHNPCGNVSTTLPSSDVHVDTHKQQDLTVSSARCGSADTKSDKIISKTVSSDNVVAQKPPLVLLKSGDEPAGKTSSDAQAKTQQKQHLRFLSATSGNVRPKDDKSAAKTGVSSVKSALKASPVSLNDGNTSTMKDSSDVQGVAKQKRVSVLLSGVCARTGVKIVSSCVHTASGPEDEVNSHVAESSKLYKEQPMRNTLDKSDGDKKASPVETDKRLTRDLPKMTDVPLNTPVQETLSPKSNSEHLPEKCSQADIDTHEQHTIDHASLSYVRTYWEKSRKEDDAVIKKASNSRTAESNCEEKIVNDPEQDAGREAASATVPRQSPDFIDFDDVERDDKQVDSKAQSSKAATRLASPHARQSQKPSISKPVAAGVSGAPTLKHLMNTNTGVRGNSEMKSYPNKICAEKKPAAPEGERKSWQSTVIIVESSDEEGSDMKEAPEVEFVKTSAAPQWPPKRKRARPADNPAFKVKRAYKPKRSPMEQHLRKNGQYNFHYTEEEAQLEQERLFKEAADRLRREASMSNNQAGGSSLSSDINELSHDHWQSPDLYRRLGLAPGAPIQLVKRQYRRMALAYHPDKGSTYVHTTARFQAVTEAYKVLCGECERLS